MRSPVLLAGLLLLLGCSPTLPRASGGAVADPRTSTSEELIAAARERGEIDEETALLYRVLAAKDAGRLPAGYVGSRPPRDGTLVVREARRRFAGLRPDVQAALRPYLFPEGAP
jgi:hypothetical protein